MRLTCSSTPNAKARRRRNISTTSKSASRPSGSGALWNCKNSSRLNAINNGSVAKSKSWSKALPTVKKEEVRDLIPDLKALNGYVVDKVEGFTIDAAGNGYVVTDNDGVDDSSGETLFFSIGPVNAM